MPRAFSEHEKQLIRNRLVKQGYRLFSAHGLKKTSVEELAEAAGISKGAFYLFYETKEALFMDVAELAEQQYRQEILAAIDLPGRSPRARLLAILQKALSLLRTIPILKSLTGPDYDLLLRRIPAEKLREHLASDRMFFEEFVARCQAADIPIRARSEEISGLLYPLVLSSLHEDDFGSTVYGGGLDLLLELVAAFCLGEVEVQPASLITTASDS